MKPFYAISIFFLFVLIGCRYQYLSQHPDQVKKLENSAEEVVEVAIESQGATGTEQSSVH